MSERSGIALNAGDSGWPVAAPAEPGPKKDGTGADLHPKAMAVTNGVVTASEEAQIVTVDPAGGTFTLTIGGQTTAAIAANANAAAVQAALEALTTVDPGDIRVTQAVAGRSLVEFLPGGPHGYAANVAQATIAVSQAEVQTLTITGTPTGGTFKIAAPVAGGGDERTVALAYNAAVGVIDAALEALASIGVGGVVVGGGPLPGTPVTITFPAASGDFPQLRAVEKALTGGTTPDVAITTTTAGGNSVSVATAAEGV